MNFEDEPYVRIYKRKTLTTKLLGWEGRAVLREMILEADRAGVIDIGNEDPVQAVAALTELPLEVVEIGLNRAVKLGSVTICDKALFIPRYMPAQEARQSDRMRQQESRARRAALVRVTKRDLVSQIVTETPDSVTPGHTVSLSDQQCSAEEDLPTVDQQRVGKPRAAAKPKQVPVPMSDSYEIPESLIAAKAQAWGVSVELVRSKVPEFRLYWIDQGVRRTPAGWARTFGTRIDYQGKRGLLLRPDTVPESRARPEHRVVKLQPVRRSLEPGEGAQLASSAIASLMGVANGPK